MKPLAAAILLLLVSACSGTAGLQLPPIVSDHMVVRRDVPAKIWGKAAPGARVTVRWQGDRIRTKADSCGRWTAFLPATPAGGPYTLKINKLTVSDVMVGEVLLGSGQSNMELPVRRCMDAVAEDVKGYSNPCIRYFAVPQDYFFDGPHEEMRAASWEVLDSEAAAMNWGAVLYFTAREMQEALGVPVGIINASLGGAPIESFMSEDILPGPARQKLAPFKDRAYLDSIVRFNSTLYSRWQEEHNALPANTGASWKPVRDMFSPSWAQDSRGANVYGSHYLRRRFNLTAAQAAGPAVLHLGTMREFDSTFVNGAFVGGTSYFYPPRNYNVPEGVLREGSNEVEVHLYAVADEPAGFVPDKRYSLETEAGEVSLLQGWEHRDGRRMHPRPGEVFLRWEPSVLWNGMIYPIKDYTTSGVIWYQGESNCGNAAEYGALLEAMISGWRTRMDAPSLPFYVIELAAYLHSELTDTDDGWNRVQKEQKRTCERMDGVEFVPNGDIGEWNDIHPQDKKTVGERVFKAISNKN